MAVTGIKLIRNHLAFDIGVANRENPATTGGGGDPPPTVIIPAGGWWQCDMWIPWYNEGQTVDHSIEFVFRRTGWDPGAPPLNTSLYIFQKNGYIYSVQSIPDRTLPDLANPILVSGNAAEGGDRSVDAAGTTNGDLSLTFY